MDTQQMTITEALQKAVAMHKSGNLQDAERLYRAILQAQPNHPDANHNLGVLGVQVGNVVSVLPHFKAALEANPKQGQFWFSYVDALVKAGEIALAQAVIAKAKALHLDDSFLIQLDKILETTNIISPHLKNNVDDAKKLQEIDEIISLFNQENYIDAENKSHAFMEKYPDEFFGYRAYGSILVQNKKYMQAIDVLRKGLDLTDQDPEIFNSYALALCNTGKPAEAIQYYEKALAINPNYAEAYNNMGIAYQDLDQLDVALTNYEMAATIKPDFAEAYTNIGNYFQAQNKYAEAIPYYQQSLSLYPHAAEPHNNIGTALQELGKHTEAIEHFNQAIAINPEYITCYNNLGTAYHDLGNFVKARGNYTKAINLKPDFSEAYYNLIDLKQYIPDNAVIETLTAIRDTEDYSGKEKMFACFALGKFYNKSKKYSESFTNFHLGHKFRFDINKNRGQGYVHETFVNTLKSYKTIFTPEFFHERSDWGSSDETPIFIVGFPRSGTSLVEQILASHSSVFGAGELQYIAEISDLLTNYASEEALFKSITHLQNPDIIEHANVYLKKIRETSGNSRHVVDKMPHNFQNLWLIQLLFPKSTIIHCTRSPEDTCLSCYFNRFTIGHTYTDDLKDLGKHYKYYLNMMAFWKKILPIEIHDINYENLTNNPDEETRHLLNLCDLEFESSCLKFYETKRIVSTASATQVREKMYTSSVGRWKRYEKFLSPLLEELKDIQHTTSMTP